MKLIFSRKGIDSQYRPRGIKEASPILPDGTMISFPIPASWKDGKYVDEGIPYKKVLINQEGFGNLYSLMLALNPTSKSSSIKDKPPFNETALCHFDPDLPSDGKHIGAFGQAGGATTHLENNRVEVGDVFLFYGTFKHTVSEGKQLQFDKDHPRHVIFGYLQVGEIWQGGELPEGIRNNHPHIINKSYANNRIYIASERLTFMPESQGWGTLPFHEKRALTKIGYRKSLWEIPAFFGSKAIEISNHKDRNRFTTVGNYVRLQTVGIGQEFVVTASTIEAEQELMDYLMSIL